MDIYPVLKAICILNVSIIITTLKLLWSFYSLNADVSITFCNSKTQMVAFLKEFLTVTSKTNKLAHQ